MFCQQDFVSEQTCETAADDLRLLDLWPPDVVFVGSFRSTKDRIFLTNPLSPLSLAVAPLPPLLLVFRRVKLKLVENFDLPFDGV